MNPRDVLIDALAEARLERLHLNDPRPASEAWEAELASVADPPSLRIRLGHRLLSLGAAIAGEDEPEHANRMA